MWFITRNRRGGKTYELVRLFKEDHNPNKVIVSFSARERDNIIHTYNIKPSQVISVQSANDARDKMIGRPRSNIYIDNVDYLLADLFKFNDIVVVTANRTIRG